MSRKLWRQSAMALAVMAILWLCVFRLYGYGMIDYTNNGSTLEPNLRRTENASHFPMPSDDACPINKYRKSFAALLQYWHTLAKFHNIPYVIGCGSLLGQYRDGEIIPWDEDVDVLVDIKMYRALRAFGGKRNFEQGRDERFHFVVQKDFERKEEEKRRRLDCSGQVVDSQIDSCSFVSPMARVVHDVNHLDIFPYIVDRGERKVRDLDMERDYEIGDFFPFKKCVFMNVRTWCPRNVRGVLESAYDNDLEPNYKCVNRTWVHNRS